MTGASMTALTMDAKLMPIARLMLRPVSTTELTITFGMGTAYRASLRAGLHSDAIELVPSVPGMFSTFDDHAAEVLSDPHGRVIVADGRNDVELTDRFYDIVVVDPPPPVESSGVSVNSSFELYRAAKARLNLRGVMMQWVPYGQNLDEFKANVGTFHDLHTNVIDARGPGCFGSCMLGSDEPLTFDGTAVRSILARPGVLEDISSAFGSPRKRLDGWAARIPRLVRLTGAQVARRGHRPAHHRRRSAAGAFPPPPHPRPTFAPAQPKPGQHSLMLAPGHRRGGEQARHAGPSASWWDSVLRSHFSGQPAGRDSTVSRRHPGARGDTARVLMLAAVVVLGAVSVAEAWAALAVVPQAHDLNLYLEATRRWLAGDGFYRPEQVAGPYQLLDGAVLYPPVVLVLLVPFTVLPAILWWAIPVAVTAWATWRHRPRPMGIVLILVSLAIPTNWWLIVAGNPTMWATAALALGTVYGWPAVAVLLKPSLAPFALFGTWRRTWWLALAAGALISLAFLPMWLDWLAVVLNARGSKTGLLYSAIDVPLLLIPLLAWVTRTRKEAASGLAGRWDWTRTAPTAPDE